MLKHCRIKTRINADAGKTRLSSSIAIGNSGQNVYEAAKGIIDSQSVAYKNVIYGPATIASLC